jgi:hypothetical protein
MKSRCMHSRGYPSQTALACVPVVDYYPVEAEARLFLGCLRCIPAVSGLGTIGPIAAIRFVVDQSGVHPISSHQDTVLRMLVQVPSRW